MCNVFHAEYAKQLASGGRTEPYPVFFEFEHCQGRRFPDDNTHLPFNTRLDSHVESTWPSAWDQISSAFVPQNVQVEVRSSGSPPGVLTLRGPAVYPVIEGDPVTGLSAWETEDEHVPLSKNITSNSPGGPVSFRMSNIGSLRVTKSQNHSQHVFEACTGRVQMTGNPAKYQPGSVFCDQMVRQWCTHHDSRATPECACFAAEQRLREEYNGEVAHDLNPTCFDAECREDARAYVTADMGKKGTCDTAGCSRQIAPHKEVFQNVNPKVACGKRVFEVSRLGHHERRLVTGWVMFLAGICFLGIAFVIAFRRWG